MSYYLLFLAHSLNKYVERHDVIFLSLILIHLSLFLLLIVAHFFYLFLIIITTLCSPVLTILEGTEFIG
jgi:hypothetical protein